MAEGTADSGDRRRAASPERGVSLVEGEQTSEPFASSDAEDMAALIGAHRGAGTRAGGERGRAQARKLARKALAAGLASSAAPDEDGE
jgi:hypothetical protein